MAADGYGNYAIQELGAGNIGYLNGYMPNDFGNLLEMAFVFIADADDATFDYSIEAAFGTDTELWNANTTGPLADQMALTNDTIHEISIASLFENISALDGFGIAFTSGVGNQTIYILGVRVKYIPNKPIQGGTILPTEFFVNGSVSSGAPV